MCQWQIDPNIKVYAYSPNYSLNISYGAEKENLLNNEELLWLVIISIFLNILFRGDMVRRN